MFALKDTIPIESLILLLQGGGIGHFKSKNQFLRIVLLKNSVHWFHFCAQDQASEQSFFNFFSFAKSRFPTKKFYSIDYWSLSALSVFYSSVSKTC